MKSIINGKSIAKESEFPKLMKHRKDFNSLIVLMTGIMPKLGSSDATRGIGFVVADESERYPIGEFGENWYMDNFADLDSNVTIELSNN